MLCEVLDAYCGPAASSFSLNTGLGLSPQLSAGSDGQNRFLTGSSKAVMGRGIFHLSSPRAVFKSSRSRLGILRDSQSHGPTVSGALRRHNHNSAACSVLPRHKECRPIEAVVPSRRTTSTKPEIFRNLSPARMKGQSSSSVWVSLLGVVFVFLVVSGCDESVCVRYP